MRRRIVILLAGLTGACGEAAPPRVGVVVSHRPLHASALAAADAGRAGGPALDLVTEFPVAPSDAEKSIAVAEALAADPGLLAVVGHASSSVSLAASQIYNAAGVVQLAPTTTAPAYSDAGRFSFRMVPSDVQQARFIAAAVAATWPHARVAVVYVNDDYGRGLSRELLQHLPAPALLAMYAENADSLLLVHTAERVLAAAPDLLVWLGRPRGLAIALGELRPALPALRVLCGDACDNGDVYRNVDGSFDGVRFVRFIDPDAADDRLREFRATYEASTGEPAAVEAILTYDAVRLLAQAVADGARSREDVRRYLLSLGRQRPPYAGLSGPVHFTTAGDAERDYLLADVLPGRIAGVTDGR